MDVLESLNVGVDASIHLVSQPCRVQPRSKQHLLKYPQLNLFVEFLSSILGLWITVLDFSHFWKKKGSTTIYKIQVEQLLFLQVVFKDPVGVRESKFDMNQVLEYRSTSLGFVGPCEWVALVSTWHPETSGCEEEVWCCLQKSWGRKKMRILLPYCYYNGRNLDLVDMEHIPSKRWLVVWDFLNHQNIQSFLWVELVTISVWIPLNSQNLRCFVEWEFGSMRGHENHSLIHGNMGL